MARYRAVIAGLGQVGLLFDEDKKRSGVWTHFTAYERLADRFELIAACEPDSSRRALASARRPDLHCYVDLEEVLAAERPDVVSLCTPPELHAPQIKLCAGKVRAVICEKPLGDDVATAAEAVTACADGNTVLAVNYYKRFDGCVPHAVELLKSNTVGELRSATTLYSGPFDAVGSHALDLLEFFAGPLMLRDAFSIGQDRLAAVLSFGREGEAILHCAGPREDLIFEIDLLGSEGRIRILDNCARLEVYRFEASPRYGGYRELFLEPVRGYVTAERFLPLFVEVAEALDGRRNQPSCDGASALETQRLMEQIRGKIERQN